MGRSAQDRKVDGLHNSLEQEKIAHAKTRQELQGEVSRWKWLASPKLLELMGIYPPLRKLLHILAEAAELQDPSRGTPIEDIMRTQFVHAGENASTSHPEAALGTHQKHRSNVRLISKELEHLRDKFTKDLDYRTHRFAQMIGASEWEYDLPERPVCWWKTKEESCPKRGVKQSFLAERCEGCGREFELARTG